MIPTIHAGVSGIALVIQVVIVGSKNAKLMFAMIRAPEQMAIYLSINKRHIGVPCNRSPAVFICLLLVFGWMTMKTMNPSKRHIMDKIRNGIGFPASE